MRPLSKAVLVPMILYSLFLIRPLVMPVLAAPTPANLLVEYMNTVITETATNKDKIKLLSPAFNLTNTVTPELVRNMDAAGANWAGLAGFAGNTYTVSGNNALFYYNQFMRDFVADKNKQIVFTEFGDFATSDNTSNRPSTINAMKLEFQHAINDSTVLSVLYFNALNTNPGFSLHALSPEELRFITEANPPKGGVNSGSIANGSPGGFPAQVTRYYDHSPNLGWTLEIITNPGDKAATITAINNAHNQGMTPIIRICYGDTCGFKDPHVYAQFLNEVAQSVGKEFYALAGPNEPDLEHWLGTTPTTPTESTIEQDRYYIHPFVLEDLRADYQPTYAESPDTYLNLGGDFDLCGLIGSGLIDCSRFVEEQRTDLLPKQIPWLDAEPEAATGLYSDRFLSAGTHAAYKPNRDNYPRPNQVMYSPYYKQVDRQRQFNDIIDYSESITIKCSRLETPEERRRCALPRVLTLDGQAMTEITFFARYIARAPIIDASLAVLPHLDKIPAISYSELLTLPQTVQDLFWQIIPQVGEGKEFKVCFWFNYLEDPNPFSSDETKTTAVFDILHFGPSKIDIKFVPFLCPIVAGTQADPTIPESTDSVPTKTRKTRLPYANAQITATDKQNRVASRYDALQESDFMYGPCIPCGRDEQCRRDELVRSMAMIINASFYNDCEQLPHGEPARIATINGQFGLSSIPRALLGALATLLSPLFTSETDNISHGHSSPMVFGFDPARTGPLQAHSYSWILQPPELLDLDITGKTQMKTFLSYQKQQTAFDQPDYTRFYRMQTGSTTANNPGGQIPLITQFVNGIEEVIKKILFGFVTGRDHPGDETVRGLLLGQLGGTGIYKLASSVTLSAASAYNFTNSPCRIEQAQADCFWWRNPLIDAVIDVTRPSSSIPNPEKTENLVCQEFPRPTGADGAPNVYEGDDGQFGSTSLHKIITSAAATHHLDACVLAGIAMVEAPHIFKYISDDIDKFSEPGKYDEMNCSSNSCTSAGPMQIQTGLCGNREGCPGVYRSRDVVDPKTGEKTGETEYYFYDPTPNWEEFGGAGGRGDQANVCNIYDSIWAAAAYLENRAGQFSTPTNAVKAYYGDCYQRSSYLSDYDYCGFVEAFCNNTNP